MVVVVVVCLWHVGNDAVRRLSGMACITQCIFVQWHHIQASRNLWIQPWQCWNLRKGGIHCCHWQCILLSWEAGHLVVHIDSLCRWELPGWLYIPYLSVTLVYLFTAGQSEWWLKCHLCSVWLQWPPSWLAWTAWIFWMRLLYGIWVVFATVDINCTVAHSKPMSSATLLDIQSVRFLVPS